MLSSVSNLNPGFGADIYMYVQFVCNSYIVFVVLFCLLEAFRLVCRLWKVDEIFMFLCVCTLICTLQIYMYRISHQRSKILISLWFFFFASVYELFICSEFRTLLLRGMKSEFLFFYKKEKTILFFSVIFNRNPFYFFGNEKRRMKGNINVYMFNLRPSALIQDCGYPLTIYSVMVALSSSCNWWTWDLCPSSRI